MRFRRFMAVILSVIVFLATLVPVHATIVDETIVNYLVVPLNNVIVKSIECIGNVLESVQQEQHEFFLNEYEFWAPLISDGVLRYDDFVDNLDQTEATNNPSEFNTVHLGNAIDDAYVTDTLANYAVVSEIVDNTVTVLGVADNGSRDKLGTLVVETEPFVWNYLSGQFPFSFSIVPWDLVFYKQYVGDQVYLSFSLYCIDTGVTKTFFTGDFGKLSTPLQRSYPFDFTTGYTYQARFTVSPSANYLYGKSKSFVVDDLYVESVYTGVIQPSVETRISSLMQALHVYNVDNSYTDNSTNTNFFMVPTDEEPAEDTVISLAIYDEETLVYSDPVTSTQYLTTGWTYDYLIRSYTLDMADDTYLIGDTVIDTIKLTYGDELLTVEYYSSGSLIQTDEYNYVMVSGPEYDSGDDEGGSGGSGSGDDHTHDYTSEITTAASCLLPGVRTYTCSCGDTYAKSIPATGHAWAISQQVNTTYDPDTGELLQQGYTVYVCNTCGEQYKDEGGTGPPNGSSGDSDGEGIWDKIGKLIGTIFDGILGLIEGVLGGLLDGLISLADMLAEKLARVVDVIMSLFTEIPTIFTGFLDFLGAVFPYIPEDMLLLLEFGLVAVIFIGIISWFRR